MIIRQATHSRNVLLRRALAVALAALTGLPVFTQPLAARAEQAQDRLPACCRREGKHGCGMAARRPAAPNPAGSAVMACKRVCPYYPGSTPAPAPLREFLVARHPRYSAPPAASRLPEPEPLALQRASFALGPHKRGPPALRPS